MRRPSASPRSARHRGFTLIEIAVVIVVLSLLLAMIAGIATAMLGQQRREATRQRLAGVETALALFVSQHQRLPCPANGSLASNHADAGKENPDPPNGTCGSNQDNGVVPWRALGLAEQDITDGWGNRLTYRVAPDFVEAPSMNFTQCDPGGTNSETGTTRDNTSGYCLAGCTQSSFSANTANCRKPSAATYGRGLRVQNLAGTPIMNPAADFANLISTGAAYVVVSHGENREGAYNADGIAQAASGADSGTEEQKNFASLTYTSACPGGVGSTCYFVDDFPVYTNPGHFDDFVLRPSILTVATKAQLGPRAH